jgi:protein SCO1/2
MVMPRSLLVQLIVGLVLGIAIVFGVSSFSQPYTYQGSLIDPPVPSAEINLPSSDGTTFNLSEQHGKIVLLFFGYTHCPDVCPTTLYDFKRIKEKLGAQSDDFRFVFITVDPERDSIEHLGEYVTTFDPRFVGLSGERDDLQTVYQAYGVYAEKNDVGSAAGYLIDHTARVYVIDAQGNLRLTFPFGMDFEAMADDLVNLMDES